MHVKLCWYHTDVSSWLKKENGGVSLNPCNHETKLGKGAEGKGGILKPLSDFAFILQGEKFPPYFPSLMIRESWLLHQLCLWLILNSNYDMYLTFRLLIAMP